MGKALELDRTTLSILTEMPFARIVQAAQAVWQQQQQSKQRTAANRDKQLSYTSDSLPRTQAVHATVQDQELDNFTKRQLAFRQRFLHKILTPDQIKQARELNLCLCRIKKAVVCLSSDHIARDCPLRKVMTGEKETSKDTQSPHQSHFIETDNYNTDESEEPLSLNESESCYYMDMDFSDQLIEHLCCDDETTPENDQALSH